MDYGFAVGGPGHFDGVECGAFGGEAKILGGVTGGVSVVEGGGGDFGGAFAVNFPGAGAVDGAAIDAEPSTDVAENGLDFIGDGAVGARPDVEKEIAVFADDVDELLDDELRGLEGVVLDVAPGLVADGSVGLPILGANVG